MFYYDQTSLKQNKTKNKVFFNRVIFIFKCLNYEKNILHLLYLFYILKKINCILLINNTHDQQGLL